MTDTIFRCLIQATCSPSSRVISLLAGPPSHSQEEDILSLLDILSILNLDIQISLDTQDIPHSLKMYNPDIQHSLKLCIPSYQTKDTRPLHLGMASLLLNHFTSSLVTPSLCLPRGSLQVTLSESSCPK